MPETQRLLLPLISADDVTALVHGHRLPHWASDFPADGDREIAGLLARTGIPSGPDADFAPRLIVERDSALAVGSAGFLGPPENGRVEVGYGLVASRRGRGYATEVVRALTALALGRPEVTEVVATVEPNNRASVHVLQKCGFTYVTRTGAGTGTEDVYVVARSSTASPPPEDQPARDDGMRSAASSGGG
jgi:RimJ/RimL family protein N-acetyltransferase